MEGAQWYVIQSKPQRELLVCAQLARISEKIDYFFPKIKNHLGIRPLFPSYLFVNLDLQNFENYRLIKFTRGVLRVMGTRGEGPLPVEEIVIATIRGRLNAQGFVDQKEIFHLGKMVRVRKGPLKDLIGILEKPVSDEGRVQVLFKLLRYPLRAMLKFEDLEVA